MEIIKIFSDGEGDNLYQVSLSQKEFASWNEIKKAGYTAEQLAKIQASRKAIAADTLKARKRANNLPKGRIRDILLGRIEGATTLSPKGKIPKIGEVGTTRVSYNNFREAELKPTEYARKNGIWSFKSSDISKHARNEDRKQFLDHVIKKRKLAEEKMMKKLEL